MTTKIQKFHKHSHSGDIVVDGEFLFGWREWERAGFTVKDIGSSSVPNGGTIWELTGPEGFSFSVYGGRTSPGEYRDFIFAEAS